MQRLTSACLTHPPASSIWTVLNLTLFIFSSFIQSSSSEQPISLPGGSHISHLKSVFQQGLNRSGCCWCARAGQSPADTLPHSDSRRGFASRKSTRGGPFPEGSLPTRGARTPRRGGGREGGKGGRRPSPLSKMPPFPLSPSCAPQGTARPGAAAGTPRQPRGGGGGCDGVSHLGQVGGAPDPLRHPLPLGVDPAHMPPHPLPGGLVHGQPAAVDEEGDAAVAEILLALLLLLLLIPRHRHRRRRRRLAGRGAPSGGRGPAAPRHRHRGRPRSAPAALRRAAGGRAPHGRRTGHGASPPPPRPRRYRGGGEFGEKGRKSRAGRRRVPHQAAAAWGGEAPAAQPPAAVTAGTARGGPAAGAPPPRRLPSARRGGGAGGDSRLPGECCMRGNKAPARGGAALGGAGPGGAPLPSALLRPGPGRRWVSQAPGGSGRPPPCPELGRRWRRCRCPWAIRPGGGCGGAIRGGGSGSEALGGRLWAGPRWAGPRWAWPRSDRLTVAVRGRWWLCAEFAGLPSSLWA